MLRTVYKNRWLFTGYLFILSVSIIFLFHFGKKEAHMLLTSFHTIALDSIMKVLTFAGDGGFMVFTGVLLMFKRIRLGITILSSFVATSIIIQVLKRLIFSQNKRPVAWFHDIGIELSRIPGVEYHSSFSFPSGHTATAFALFFGLAFFSKNNSIKFIFLLLSCLIAFTRIYLSQHFLGDAIAGSLIGVTSALFFQWFYESKNVQWLEINIIALFSSRNERSGKI
jgi:membrane-associated phospholipid phosphatase